MWCAIKVIDDTHQNPGSGWNGDSVQIMFTNAARPQGGTAKTGELDTPAGMILYNYGLSDDGDYTAHHESHPCPSDDDCTEMAAIRFEDDKTTIYEIKFPAASLGQDAYVAGFSFGLGTCINDGDDDAVGDGAGTNQSGQGGWSGWSPYGIVMGGKQVENNGLATLVW